MRRIKNYTLRALGFAALALAGCEPATPSEVIERAYSRELKYEEFLAGNAREDEELPLVVALHGLGGRPFNFAATLAELPTKARIILPRAPIPYGHGFAWFPFRVGELNQQEDLIKGIELSAGALVRLIERVKKEKPTRGRPILAGFSQGGIVAFYVALAYPQAAKLVIPFGGTVPRKMWPKKVKQGVKLPIVRALHGKDDERVRYAYVDEFVDFLTSIGYDAELSGYPGCGHAICEQTQQDLFSLIVRAVREPE